MNDTIISSENEIIAGIIKISGIVEQFSINRFTEICVVLCDLERCKILWLVVNKSLRMIEKISALRVSVESAHII